MSMAPRTHLPARISAAIVLIAAAGCGGPPPAQTVALPKTQDSDVALNTLISEPTDAQPVAGDWIVQRLGAEPAHLNMLLDTGDAYSARICSFVFEGLLERDNLSLELKPFIAESYEVSADHLTYTFRLRRDVTFSDGTPLTAEDVKFTYETIMNPQHETADLRNYYQDIESAEVLEDSGSGGKYAIRFTCRKPYFRHLTMIGEMPIYPRHIYSHGNFNTHANNRAPIGSGPYVFEGWDTNQQIALKRNANYWNKEREPYLDRLVWKIVTDDDSAFEVFSKGEMDTIALRPEQWVNRANTPDFEAKFNKYKSLSRPRYIGGYSYIAWNLRKPMFQDKRVRQALTMLLDRQTILETVFYGLGEVVTGPEFSKSREYDASIAPWPFDPARAAELLAEAGWSDSNSDGVLDKDGMRFEFGFMFPSSVPEYERLATVYQEELKRAGIRMTVLQREWASFLDSVTKRAFDAVSLAWAIPPDSEPYQVWHSSQSEKGSNYPGFNNPEADRLLENIRVEFDREKRIPMFHRFHAIIHEEQPYTFLYNSFTLGAIDKRFRNVYIYALGADPREFWVPAGLQRYGAALRQGAAPR